VKPLEEAHMRYRKLGKTGIEVSEIGFGAWGIGGGWGERDDRTALAALERALELGLTFIDTALAYGEGHSERLIGEAVRGSGRDVVIATKVPPKDRVWPAQKGSKLADVFPKDYVLECTDRSLENLGVERLDVQQFHVWDDAWAQEDEWRETVAELKRSGRVRAFGLSINDHEPKTRSPRSRPGSSTACRSSTTSSTRPRRSGCCRPACASGWA
jgi:aryl-alcohol dehydrogenase-like predicted oxidoreductase